MKSLVLVLATLLGAGRSMPIGEQNDIHGRQPQTSSTSSIPTTPTTPPTDTFTGADFSLTYQIHSPPIVSGRPVRYSGPFFDSGLLGSGSSGASGGGGGGEGMLMGRPGGRRGRLDSSTPEAARPSTASSSGGSYIDGWGEGTLMGGTGGRRGRPSSGGAGVGQSDDGLADNEFDHLIADNQQGFNDPNVAPLNATRTASRTASATIAPAGVSTPTASPSAATGVGATALADYLREATISEAEHWDEFWRDSDEEEYFESHENRTATIAGTNGTSQAGTPTAASPTDAAAPTATAGNGGGNQGGGADGELRHRKRGSVSCLSC